MHISKPYKHGSGFRCRITVEGSAFWCPAGRTPEAAIQEAEDAKAAHIQGGGLTVREAIAACADAAKERGNRDRSIKNEREFQALFFSKELDWSLSRVTPAVAGDAYQRVRTRPSKYGREMAPNSHRSYLAAAKRLMLWCVEQSMIRSSPLAGVKPVGRKRAGKEQLTIDELKRLWAYCLSVAHEEPAAVAVLLALATGMRAGEVVSRTVRDLDNGGQLLRVGRTEHGFRTKTDRDRTVRVPASIQPHLLALTKDKVGGALLWQAKDGGAHWPQWLRAQVKDFCERAGVPIVCAHSLRGSHATTALTAGATPDLVASALGHESAEITLRHYAQAGSAESAQQEARVLMFEDCPKDRPKR